MHKMNHYRKNNVTGQWEVIGPCGLDPLQEQKLLMANNPYQTLCMGAKPPTADMKGL